MVHTEQYISAHESVEPSTEDGGCQTVSTTEAERLDNQLSTIVAGILNVEPSRLAIRTFPGNHVITDDLVVLLKCGKFDALYGEMNIESILERLQRDTTVQSSPKTTAVKPLSLLQQFQSRFKRMKYPSLGSSDYEKAMDAENMQQLLALKIALVAGDSNDEAFLKHYKVYEEYPYDVDRVNVVVGYLAGILIGVGAGALIGRLPEYVLHNWLPTRRKLLRFALWGGAALAAYNLYRHLSAWYQQAEWVERPISIGRSTWAEQKAKRQIDFEKTWYTDSPFGTFSEVLIPFRNRGMAQNFLSYIAGRLYGYESHVNVASYYGTLHGEVYDEIAKGPYALRVGIAADARRFLSQTYNFLEKMHSKKVSPEEEEIQKKYLYRDLINAFTQYAGMFAEQYSVDPTDYGVLRTKESIPPTARTIFIDEMKAEIGRLADCATNNQRECKYVTLREVEDKLLKEKTANLISIAKTTGDNFIYFDQQVLQDPEIAVAYAHALQDYQAEVNYKTTHDKRLTSEYGFFLDHFTSTLLSNFSFLGWGKVRGQYAPVIRETIDDENGVRSRDIMLVSPRERVILNTYQYELIGSAQELEALKAQKKTYLHQYVSTAANYTWAKDEQASLSYKENRFYKLKEEEIDPFGIYIVEVFRPGQTDSDWHDNYPQP